MIGKTRARKIIREMFPLNLYGTNYKTYEGMRSKDPMALADLFDHIQYCEPYFGQLKEYQQN